jgi:diguanylate cyclase (GGDEF)-like protein
MTKKIFIQERELLKAKEKAEKLATHDHLTELPNRRLLQDRVEKNILMAKKNKIKIAICVVDLDDFKQINDNYGHLAGDEILKETALRISNILREYDTVSRIGGDEFVMLLMNVKDKEGCAHVLNRLLDSIRQPFIINNLNINITFSIGLALYPDDGKNFEELFSRADLALYDAKKNCKNGFCFYDEEQNID